MKIPKVATDDLLLSGSFAASAFGAALIALDVTHSPLLAIGVALLVFGVPSALIVFMAAGQETK